MGLLKWVLAPAAIGLKIVTGTISTGAEILSPIIPDKIVEGVEALDESIDHVVKKTISDED